MDSLFSPDDYVLGIDFGTTNTCAAYCQSGQDLVVLPIGPAILLESLVYVFNGPPCAASVGSTAETQALAKGQADLLISGPKSNLGNPEVGRETFRRKYRSLFSERSGTTDPEDMVAIILRYLQETAERNLRRNRQGEPTGKETFSRAVLGIPAAAGTGFRIALKRAAEMAGFEHSYLMPEPIAGTLDYLATTQLSMATGELLLAIDVGAGTTDVTLVEKTEDGMMVRLTDGDMRLGGNRTDWLLLEMARQREKNADFLPDRINLKKLREFKEKVNTIADQNDAEKYEETLFLSSRDKKSIQVSFKGADALSACAQVTKGIGTLLERFLADDARLSERQGPISQVLLLGGAARMRPMREFISKLSVGPMASRFRLREDENTQKHAPSPHDPRAAVARGLARVGADWKAGRIEWCEFNYQPRLSRDLGLAVVDDSRTPREFIDKLLYHSVHLRKHTGVARSEPQIYGLPKRHHDSVLDALNLQFLIGGEVYVPPDASDELKARYYNECECIGELSFPLVPKRKGSDVQIRLQYVIDAEGLTTVRIRDLGFEDLSNPAKRRSPDTPEQETVIPLRFGAVSDEEAVQKRKRLSMFQINGPDND